MRTLFALFFMALAGVLFCVAPSLVAQDKATKLKDGVFKVNGLLARDDPKDRVRTSSVHKVHSLNLVAGKTYTIDLESSDFDAYLRLENSTGKQLAQDDDSGNGLNARIIFRAPKDDTYKIIATTFIGGTGNYTLTVKGAGLGVQKPQEKAPLAVLSKDFLPHKPGTILYYDNQMNVPNGSIVVSRWKHVQKDNGVVEKTLEKIGTLKAGESILQGATVTWLKEVNEPTKVIEHHRLQGGFIEIGIDHAGNGKIIWEPVLKIGAKSGEAWKWESPIGFKLYESWGVREANGRLSVTIYATSDIGNTKIRSLVWYEEGKGVVKSSIATAKGDEKPIVTAESVLVQDSVGSKQKIAPVQEKPANAEEKGVLQRLKGHSVVYSPDGRYLAISSDDGNIVWDVKGAKEISKCVPEIKGNPETLYSTSKGALRLAFSANGKYLYADIARSELSNLKKMFFGTIFVFESSNGKQVHSYDFHNVATPRGPAMFSPNGAALFVTTNPVNKKVEVFATETGNLVHQFDMIKIPGTNVADFLASISISPDKKRLLIAGNYGRMYSLEDGKELRVLQWPGKRVQEACFCPDGKRVLLTFHKSIGLKTEFKFVVFNTESEKEEQTLEGGGVDGSFWKFAVSPDGQMAFGGSSKAAILWSIASGKQLRTHKGFSSVAFSPKGDSYAVCAGGVVTIYEAPKLPSSQKIEEKKESKETAPKEAPKQEKVPNETKPEKTLDKKEKVEHNAANPKVLEEKTWTWEGSKENYAKCKDLTFEVGMGNKPDGVGCADAGVEIENVRSVRLSVDAPPSYNRYDDNSFAGFMVDYHTSAGYTKRVGLTIGMYSEKRWAKTPIWGKVTVPSQFVDLGKKKEYDLDLQKWAPDGWDGRVWFVVSLQNTGRNTTLKAKAELLGEQERPQVAQKPKEEPGKKDEKALRKIAQLGTGIHAIKKDDKGRVTSCIVVGRSDFSTLLGKAKGMQDARLRARHVALTTFILWLRSDLKKAVNKTTSSSESLLPNLEVLHAEVDEKDKSYTLVMGWDAKSPPTGIKTKVVTEFIEATDPGFGSMRQVISCTLPDNLKATSALDPDSTNGRTKEGDYGIVRLRFLGADGEAGLVYEEYKKQGVTEQATKNVVLIRKDPFGGKVTELVIEGKDKDDVAAKWASVVNGSLIKESAVMVDQAGRSLDPSKITPSQFKEFAMIAKTKVGLDLPFDKTEIAQKPKEEPGKKDKKDDPAKSTLSDRLAGTKWVNTNKVFFEWDASGKFYHNGTPRDCKVVDNLRLDIVFSEKHTDTLVFNSELTAFEQYSTSVPNARPLFRGTKIAENKEVTQKPKEEPGKKGAKEADKTLTELTADFFPHIPGTVYLYDTDYYPIKGLPAAWKDKRVRTRCTLKDGGVIEAVVFKEGTRTNGKVDWTKEVNRKSTAFDALYRRNAEYVETGIPWNDTKTQVLWFPTIKIGAKEGESWQWRHPFLKETRKYVVTDFDTYKGRPSVEIVVESTQQLGNIVINYVHRKTYAKGIGLVASTTEWNFPDDDRGGKPKWEVTVATRIVEDEKELASEKAEREATAKREAEVGKKNRYKTPIQILKHEDAVLSVAFSSDGKSVVTVSWGGIVRVLNIGDGKELQRWKLPNDFATPLAVSSDGQLLAALSKKESVIRVWTRKTGDKLIDVAYKEKPPEHLTFSNDGTLLAIAYGQNLTLVSTSTAKEVTRISLGKGQERLSSVVISQDNAIVATAAIEGFGLSKIHVKSWRVATGEPMLSLTYMAGGTVRMAFSPSGEMIAVASYGSGVRVFHASTGKELQSQELEKIKGNLNTISSLAFSPDGKRLITGANDRVVVWNTQTWKKDYVVNLHDGFIYFVAFSPTEATFATASFDKTVQLLPLRRDDEQVIEEKPIKIDDLKKQTLAEIKSALGEPNEIHQTSSPTAKLYTWKRDAGYVVLLVFDNGNRSFVVEGFAERTWADVERMKKAADK